ncbi:uncharacterized protein [Penaeus vannamei]|uniref:uncharacterized protein n=1 Tax=Penaeus vannamei TaxID=6689 RepID=UPI00387F5E04
MARIAQFGERTTQEVDLSIQVLSGRKSVVLDLLNLGGVVFDLLNLGGVVFDLLTLRGVVFELLNLGGVVFDLLNLGVVVFDLLNLGGVVFDLLNLGDVVFDQLNLGGVVFDLLNLVFIVSCNMRTSYTNETESLLYHYFCTSLDFHKDDVLWTVWFFIVYGAYKQITWKLYFASDLCSGFMGQLKMSLLEILEKAQSLGLSGDLAHELIEKQHQAEREERAAEREVKKMELEFAEAEKRRAHELELAKIQSGPNGNHSNPHAPMFEGLRLPTFADGQDDLDSYLQRFERLAELHGWKVEDYHVYLGTCLRGQALKVYISLPDDIIKDYSRLKEALLRAYSVDADSYRRKFRESRCKDKETYVQLVIRMEQYLDRWVTMSNVEKKYDSLFEFLVREQLLNNCGSDLRVFLKERGCETAVEMAESADRYRSAHGYRASKFSRSVSKQPTLPVESEIQCHGCGKSGHIRPNCPNNPKNFKPKNESKVNFVFQSEVKPQNTVIDAKGTLFDTPAEILVYDYLGIPDSFPKVRCFIKSKFFTGWINAIAAPIKFADVLIGLVPGVELPGERDSSSSDYEASKDTAPDSNYPQSNSTTRAVTEVKDVQFERDGPHDPILPTVAMAVKTRSSESKSAITLACPEFLDLNITKINLKDEQQNCQSLKSIRDKVKSGENVKVKSRTVKYELVKDLIYRVCLKSKHDYEIGSKQLVIPEKYRIHVLNLAHDSLTAGHFSHRKTSYKVFSKFFWPGAGAQIKRYCRSCPTCQKFSSKGSVKRVPMKNLPIISEPFSRVAIDLVGPFSPASERGNKYVLTLIDYATRYPEAVALKNIDTITVAESLVEIFSRVGIPREILSDRGSQFKSDLMSEIHRLLSVKALYTSPYHASCNGAVERLNGVLKSMIKKLCADHPRAWDRFIPAALFAYREIPNDSLKFSPFELLYGRQVRGPLTILHELWTNDSIDSEVKTTYQYVLDLRSRLEETARLAAEQAEISSRNYKAYYDLKAKPRKLNTGDDVLVLLPSSSNKLVMQWLGPYSVVECKGNGVDYVIRGRGKNKLFHINMLKKYFRRDGLERKGETVQVCVVEDEDNCNNNCKPVYFETDSDNNINMGSELSESQVDDLKVILKEFSDVLTDKPGLTDSIEHVIHMNTDKPVRQKPYPIPNSLVKEFNKEVDKMFEMNIIEPSTSPYCSPVVMVKKSDGTWRVCIDFRGINDASEFDAEPMPTTDSALGNFVSDIYFSEIDLCRGYCDASDLGLGAVLLQDVNGVKMPIAYASRKLLDREKNYATIEKECLSIVWAIHKFKLYLYGKEFIIQTDQRPLVYLRNMKNTNGRLMRWALALQCYTYSIDYIKGSENVGADVLSRCPLNE